MRVGAQINFEFWILFVFWLISVDSNMNFALNLSGLIGFLVIMWDCNVAPPLCC